MMNEQELADLFSTQVDHMLHGEAVTFPPDAGELPELLDIAGRLASQAQFQASAPAQAVFQSQVTGWFGLNNGGSPMTILGLSKIWFISILVTVFIGLGLVTVFFSSLLIFTPVSSRPASPTAATVTAGTSTPQATPGVTTTATVSASPTGPVQPTAAPTPASPAGHTRPSLMFRSNIYVPSLCQGAYTVQRRLVNYGNKPVRDAALVWEVIEGTDLVEHVSLDSGGTTVLVADDTGSTTGSGLALETDTALATTGTITPEQVNYMIFSPIAVKQEVDIRVKVKVKDAWWDQPDGTTVKVKLHVKNKVKIKDSWHHDDDDDDHYQVITVVKQNGKWITLAGFPQNYGEGKMLLGGYVVVTNNCTGLPVHWPSGSKVKVIGSLQPDGTFMAINIIVVNVNVNLNFDSGVPQPRDDGGSSSGGGGGGKSCSGKGCSGGSKGGSGGSGGS